MSPLLITYVCLFTVGFVFIVGAFVFGDSHDADHDHDFGGHDHDGNEAEDDNSMSPSVFSTKVIAFFLMGFGLAAAFSHLNVSGETTSVLKVSIDVMLGLAGGVILGWIGWLVIRGLLRQQAHSNFHIERWVGVKSHLTLIAEGQNCGEISATVDGQLRSLDVRSENGERLPTGTYVEVLRVDGQVGVVRKCS